MELDLQVRFATIKDIPAIVAFNKSMAWETEKKALDEKILASGVKTVLNGASDSFYIVAVDSNSNPLGSLMITKEWSDWRNAFIWWIQSVYVLPQYRNKGIFKKLYSHIKELAKIKRICVLRLYVDKSNKLAQKTYSSLGMHESNYLIYEEMTDAK